MQWQVLCGFTQRTDTADVNHPSSRAQTGSGFTGPVASQSQVINIMEPKGASGGLSERRC